MESVFLGGSHRESLPERFPLNCVTKSAHGRGFLLPPPPDSIPAAPASSWQSLCMAVRASHSPPTQGTTSRPAICCWFRDVSLPKLWKTHSLNIPLSSFFWEQINLGCFPDSLLTSWHSVPAKEQVWACKMSLLYSGWFPQNHGMCKSRR